MMNNFYYVAKENLKELNLETDKETVLCLKDEPFRNWIVAFDVFDSSGEDEESMNLEMEYEAIYVPQEVLDIQILDLREELGIVLRDIVLETLTNHIESLKENQIDLI